VLLPPFFCDGTVTSALHTLSLHDALPICLRALELARSKTRIEQDERMEVAVAGMKDVRHAQPMSHARVLYEPQDVWEPSARDDAVLHVIIRREPTHRGERALAARPEPLTIEGRCRDPHLACRVLAADLLDPRPGGIEAVARSVD